jgi:hypothetical protein
MTMSLPIVEKQMKALKSLLIKLPTAIVLVSMLVIFIIAICLNPMIPMWMIRQTISLSSHVPLTFSVWLLLSALMGVLALNRRKRSLKSILAA